jgi:hypothetical protein
MSSTTTNLEKDYLFQVTFDDFDSLDYQTRSIVKERICTTRVERKAIMRKDPRNFAAKNLAPQIQGGSQCR